MTFYMPFLKTRLSFDKKYLIDHALYYIFNLKQYLQHRFFLYYSISGPRFIGLN